MSAVTQADGTPLPIDPETDRAPSPQVLLAVLLGGCVGGLARYGVVSAWPERQAGFPWSVLAINCSGAFLLALMLRSVPDRHARVRALLGTGFCGAWTTFSSITVSADQLLADGRALSGVSYVLASAAGGLAAAWLGLALARRLSC